MTGRLRGKNVTNLVLPRLGERESGTETLREIAQSYNVSHQTISRLVP